MFGKEALHLRVEYCRKSQTSNLIPGDILRMSRGLPPSNIPRHYVREGDITPPPSTIECPDPVPPVVADKDFEDTRDVVAEKLPLRVEDDPWKHFVKKGNQASK